MSPAPLHEPQLFRFRLGSLLAVVALLSLLCAVWVLADRSVALAMSGGVALVAAHVLGTLLGTRLRDTSQQVEAWRATQRAPEEQTTPEKRGLR
jgi:hypothetical protein